MQIVKRALAGGFQAVVGAYVGALIFVVLNGALLSVLNPQGGPYFAASAIPGMFMMSFIGTLYLIWWIVPMGILFGLVLKDRIVRWPPQHAWAKGALLGGLLGLITAVLLAITTDRPGTPALTILTAFLFLPVYCAGWSGTFARRWASPSR